MPAMIVFNRFLAIILIRWPILEVLVKNLYHRHHWVQRALAGVNRSSMEPRAAGGDPIGKESEKVEQFISACEAFGIRDGDILLVHSTNAVCQMLGLSPSEMLSTLRSIIGARGTLAMPCFPIIKGAPKGTEKFDDSSYNERLIYNVQRSSPWTGILAKQLLQTPGSIRSRNPINALVAIGPEAKNMMRDNLSEFCKPHGSGSSWHFCYENNAKVLLLDCDPAHTLTLVHLKEDLAESEWPISGDRWYRNRLFKVIDGDHIQDITVLERRAEWNCFFAERRLEDELRRNDIVRKTKVGALQLGCCEAKHLCDFLSSTQDVGAPYFIPRVIRWMVGIKT